MNTRLVNIALVIQVFFAVALIYVGYQAREKRRVDYLELTHRVTTGWGTAADFEKLAGFIPERAEKAEIRALFGLPLLRASQVALTNAGKTEVLKGDVWLYYVMKPVKNSEQTLAPLDASEAAKLKEPVSCFVVNFNARGRAEWRMAEAKVEMLAIGN